LFEVVTLDLIFGKRSRNRNEFELSFPLLHSLVHLDVLIIPTWLLTDEIMLDDNISALNAATPPISNGIAPFTNVKHAEKRHLDMHHELVMDVSMMMESAAITISRDTMMEILPENANLHLSVCIYLFFLRSKVERFSLRFLHFPLFHQTNYYNVSPSYFIFKPHHLSFNQQTLPTCHPSQTFDLVSQGCGSLHLS
jgi:hypothetical protein